MSETQEVNGKSQTPENETSGKKTEEKPREPPIIFKDLDVSFMISLSSLFEISCSYRLRRSWNAW